MSEDVEQALRAAGWHEGRSCEELAKWRGMLSQSGVTLLAPAERALAEFGGLRVQSTQRTGRDFAPVSMLFDPTKVDLEQVRAFESVLGRALSPLAETDGGNGALVIDAQGHVHLIYDDHVQVGRSIREAIELLFEGKRFSVDR